MLKAQRRGPLAIPSQSLLLPSMARPAVPTTPASAEPWTMARLPTGPPAALNPTCPLLSQTDELWVAQMLSWSKAFHDPRPLFK